MWFKRFADRLEAEKQSVAAVLEGWVHRVEWHVDEADGTVTADVDFEGGGQLREAKLVFPFVYPFCPLQVMPRSEGVRWSAHQWPNGELCLEFRADNWRDTFDARDMLESARRLLDTEATLDDAGLPLQVASAHRVTEGQLLAWQMLHLVMTDTLKTELVLRGTGVQLLDMHKVNHDNCVVFIAVGMAGSPEHERWIDPGVPDHFSSAPNSVARVAVMEEGDARHLALLDESQSPAEVWQSFSSIPFDGQGTVIGLINGVVLGKWLATKVYDIAEVPMDNQPRSLVRNSAVAGKRVAIVGCGSMGSKVAASLARSGVTKFLLIDGDVMKSGNLTRNDLDWNAVGAHKVDGVAKRLRAIQPDVDIERWIGQFGSHHSTGNVLTCLKQLAGCDLIVEGTGSGQGFGYAASVASTDQIAMVWGRVFGGGYGGYVTRCRPGLERSPLEVRHEIHLWLTQPNFPKPPRDSDIDYAAEPDDQSPMIADDTDVSVISAHLARMALDTLRPVEETDYPHSAYVIGLRKEWIFENGPFDTFSVTLQPPEPSDKPQAVDQTYAVPAPSTDPGEKVENA
jgi:ubiquitin-protein ligase